MKEAVENKKVELKQSSTKTQANYVDVLRLIDTSDLYGLINDNINIKLADTGLESNNTLGANIVKEKEGWFYGWADKYDVWNNYSYTPTKENEPRSSHMFTDDNSIIINALI